MLYRKNKAEKAGGGCSVYTHYSFMAALEESPELILQHEPIDLRRVMGTSDRCLRQLLEALFKISFSLFLHTLCLILVSSFLPLFLFLFNSL